MCLSLSTALSALCSGTCSQAEVCPRGSQKRPACVFAPLMVTTLHFVQTSLKARLLYCYWAQTCISPASQLSLSLDTPKSSETQNAGSCAFPSWLLPLFTLGSQAAVGRAEAESGPHPTSCYCCWEEAAALSGRLHKSPCSQRFCSGTESCFGTTSGSFVSRISVALLGTRKAAAALGPLAPEDASDFFSGRALGLSMRLSPNKASWVNRDTVPGNRPHMAN